MLSRDVIDVKLKRIKKNLKWQNIVLLSMYLIKLVVWMVSLYTKNEIKYSDIIGLDVSIILTLFCQISEIPKLCDVLSNVNERNSTSEDEKN